MPATYWCAGSHSGGPEVLRRPETPQHNPLSKHIRVRPPHGPKPRCVDPGNFAETNHAVSRRDDRTLSLVSTRRNVVVAPGSRLRPRIRISVPSTRVAGSARRGLSTYRYKPQYLPRFGLNNWCLVPARENVHCVDPLPCYLVPQCGPHVSGTAHVWKDGAAATGRITGSLEHTGRVLPGCVVVRLSLCSPYLTLAWHPSTGAHTMLLNLLPPSPATYRHPSRPDSPPGK